MAWPTLQDIASHLAELHQTHADQTVSLAARLRTHTHHSLHTNGLVRMNETVSCLSQDTKDEVAFIVENKEHTIVI